MEKNFTEKSAFISTFGCQMNVHDSQRMAAILESAGFAITDNIYAAEIIIVVTCSVREKPEQRLASFLNNNVKKLKKVNPSIVVAVAGCVAQQKGSGIIEDFPFVDMVMGPDGIDNLAGMYHAVKNSQNSKQVFTGFTDDFSYPHTLLSGSALNGSHAYVTAMKGCNSYCSYCIVPYVRGPERSRKSDEIVADVKNLVQKGITSITLLGQNISNFGKDNAESLDNLLRTTASVKGIKRLSFITSHPRDFDPSIIKCMEDFPVIDPLLHLPAQHGSDKILKAMNRGYTRAEYIEKINTLKKSPAWNRLSVTTDVIIGFPGEDDRDFEDLMFLLEEVKFDNSFSFIYSPRPGTRAYREHGATVDPVLRDVYTRRLMKYQERQKQISLQKNTEMVGNVFEVLTDGISHKDSNKYTGRTATGKVVNFDFAETGDILTGKYTMVKITRAHPTHLTGKEER